MGYCLPDSITSISFSNPETSSRVTLATLGIVFQTKLITNYKHGAECCLPDKTYYKLQTWSGVLSSRQNLLPTTNMEFSAGWKPVPSVSESNPGRSLGIYNHGENCCLEDSTSHRAKHPLQSVKSVFEKKTRRR